MRFQKIISVITMCAIVSGTALSVHAVDTADTTSNTIAYSETDGVLSAYAEQVAVLVNQERAANGLEPLRFSPQLSEAASVRAAELPQSFSHTRQIGRAHV